MNETKSIPFNFTYYAMKLLGKNLYSTPWTAISEIVANGIDANANNVYVLVDMNDKKHAKVEIFDDGIGMSSWDLSNKYALIGRNKRLSDDNKEGKTLGRKGIGKLAALYLSPQYYLYTKTKTDGLTAWIVDTENLHDNDTPALKPIAYDTSHLLSKHIWNDITSGTMIHLSDVDLRKIGTERLKSLPVILSDYYLDTVIQTKIHICVLEDKNSVIEFTPIIKNINFSTFFGFYDNTDLGYKDLVPTKVYLTKEGTVPKEIDIPRDTVIPEPSKFNFVNTIELTDLNGEKRNVQYEMIGWIGIHCSLDEEILKRNNPEAKKIQNHPNSLRLYVRGKLAVNNLMNYIGSNQAFANYIEGEISFDILDDDRFEDASTSSREGYSINDPRIIVLLNIVKQIINYLMSERSKIGNIIHEEERDIERRKELELRKQRELEQSLRLAAEQQTNVEKTARMKAENERDIYQKKNEIAQQRLFVLENKFTNDGEIYRHGMHLAVNFAKIIRGDTVDFSHDLQPDFKSVQKTLMNIDREAAKIENLPHYIDSVEFPLTSPNITIDIIEFIKEYLETKGSTRLSYKFNIFTELKMEVDFAEIIMFIENAVSNSIKARATTLLVNAYKTENSTIIDLTDNGKGLHKKFKNNPDQMFDLGETTTVGGFGIGTYHMKEIITKLGGTIHAIPNEMEGMTIRVEFK